MSDYTFSIVSQDKHHEGDEFRIFNVDGEDVIGVEEKEPFELRFRNNTNGRVQVRLSVDGTDVLSGEPASTKPTGQMFLVSPGETMRLKAWPESLQGGARFVFTTKERSVAVNTHGSTAGIGLIAAAVFADYDDYRYLSAPTAPRISRFQAGSPVRGGGLLQARRRSVLRDARDALKSITKGGPSGSSTKAYYQGGGNDDDVVLSAQSLDFCASGPASINNISEASNMAVGAGEYTDQTLVKAAGLRRPVLDEVLQVRYLPWDKLRKLVDRRVVEATAFPGDQNPGVDLSNVPRTKSTGRKHVEVQRFL